MKCVVIGLILFLICSNAHALPVVYTVSGYTYEFQTGTKHDLIGSIWLNDPVAYTAASGLEWVRFDILDLFFYTEPRPFHGTGSLNLNTYYGPSEYYINCEIDSFRGYPYENVFISSSETHPVHPSWPSPYVFPDSFSFYASLTAVSGTEGRSFNISAVRTASVPEPATLLIFSCGIIALAVYRRNFSR